MVVDEARRSVLPAYDVAITGGGIAGLTVALRLPMHTRVALFTKGLLGESNTRYAQGGVAVALGADDSPELHFQDTVRAGAGLCDEEAVRVLVEQGPAAVRWLIERGAQFDRATPNDAHASVDGFSLGREGAHSRWRVLHANGDATGAEIERAMIAALRTRPALTVFEETFVQQLLVEHHRCVGVRVLTSDGQSLSVRAAATVLANGGAGGLWLHTSNPAGATADGLALAYNAGAALSDLEFVQFHPTVLAAQGTSHLISEAVRGEGAYLRNHAGERFMLRYSEQQELAPRDVVARALLEEMLAEGTDCQYLDLRHLPSDQVHQRFPTISAICRQFGLDLARDFVPVAPAAHYCMGGVLVDTWGRTTVPGLYAVGEVACTGVHGANRLASNSLLEGLVYGVRVADRLAEQPKERVAAMLKGNVTLITVPPDEACEALSAGHDEYSVGQVRQALRQIMWHYVSLSRERAGLLEAQRQVRLLRQHVAHECTDEQQKTTKLKRSETQNMLQVADVMIHAALQRCESRGSHWRLDYPVEEAFLAQQHFAFQRGNQSLRERGETPKEVLTHG